MNDYYQKYIKYKEKYLQLKNSNNILVGGAKRKSKLKRQDYEFTITIKQPWFNLIKSGKKTVEGRLNSGLFAKLQIGNIITWLHHDMKCKVKIISIKKYDSFRTMLEKEGLDKVLPTIDNIDEGVKLYRQYYSEEREKVGVLAIEMELYNQSRQKKLKNKNNKLTRQEEKIINMNTFEGKLQSPYYEYIRDGIKIYEMRINDEKRQKMNVGDIWKFKHMTDETLPQYNTKIVDKKIYESFEEAIEDTGYEKLLPNANSKEEAIQIYNAFDNGNFELEAKKYGVVRFTLEVIHHILPIQNPKDCPTYDYIKSGIKTVEGRLYKSKYIFYQIGDKLTFVNNDTKEEFPTIITDIRKYKTLEDYLVNEGFDKVLPCVKSMKNAIDIYNRWSNEKERKELQDKYGFSFMGIQVKNINVND